MPDLLGKNSTGGGGRIPPPLFPIGLTLQIRVLQFRFTISIVVIKTMSKTFFYSFQIDHHFNPNKTQLCEY